MIKTFYSACIVGVDAQLLKVECRVMPGPNVRIAIMGLKPKIGSICKNRILSALHYYDIRVPNGKYIINISPADSLINNSSLDLVIAISMMNCLELIPDEVLCQIKESIILGEISLTGDIRPIHGTLSIALSLADFKKKSLLLPYENVAETSLLKSIKTIPINKIENLFDHTKFNSTFVYQTPKKEQKSSIDFSQVYGQYAAKRAIEIAASGMHHMMFFGPPGCGKTMISQRVPTILPEMTEQEKIEVTKIYSCSNMLGDQGIIESRPFRSPHHSITPVGLIGGGVTLSPGDISLAHNGVLFLDEFLEFQPANIEMLRQVLEDKKVHIKRVGYSVTIPASFMLIVSMNPCPCGFYGSTAKKCSCSFYQTKQYLSKISGPLLDRIDMQVGLQQSTFTEMKDSMDKVESSKDILVRVKEAVNIQRKRNPSQKLNAFIESYEIKDISSLDKQAEEYGEYIYEKLNLSMRSYHKIMKISRTIADLEGSISVSMDHIKEALSYRSFEKVMARFNEN